MKRSFIFSCIIVNGLAASGFESELPQIAQTIATAAATLATHLFFNFSTFNPNQLHEQEFEEEATLEKIDHSAHEREYLANKEKAMFAIASIPDFHEEENIVEEEQKIPQEYASKLESEKVSVQDTILLTLQNIQAQKQIEVQACTAEKASIQNTILFAAQKLQPQQNTKSVEMISLPQSAIKSVQKQSSSTPSQDDREEECDEYIEPQTETKTVIQSPIQELEQKKAAPQVQPQVHTQKHVKPNRHPAAQPPQNAALVKTSLMARYAQQPKAVPIVEDPGQQVSDELELYHENNDNNQEDSQDDVQGHDQQNMPSPSDPDPEKDPKEKNYTITNKRT